MFQKSFRSPTYILAPYGGAQACKIRNWARYTNVFSLISQVFSSEWIHVEGTKKRGKSWKPRKSPLSLKLSPPLLASKPVLSYWKPPASSTISKKRNRLTLAKIGSVALWESYLSAVNMTTVSMDADVTDSAKTLLKSQKTSPNGQGYWCHMENTSIGMAEKRSLNDVGCGVIRRVL